MDILLDSTLGFRWATQGPSESCAESISGCVHSGAGYHQGHLYIWLHPSLNSAQTPHHCS